MKTTKALFGILTITMVLAVQVQAQNWLTNGLVAYYPFNGNANDASGNGNNGQLGTGTSFTTGRFGNSNSALTYSNAATWTITTSVQQPVSDVFSLCLWLNLSPGVGTTFFNFTSTQTGFSPTADKLFGANSSGLTFYLFPGHQVYLNALLPVSEGTWHHAVATLSSQGMCIYFDGLLVAQNTAVTNSAGYSGWWRLANEQGIMDDVRIYNRALSVSEVRQLYAYESQTHWDGPFQIVAGGFSWTSAKADAESRGGHLATFGTQAKWNALVNEFSNNSGIVVDAWIGGYQPSGSPEPAGNWTWVTGEPWTFSAWWPGEPNNSQGKDDALIICFGGIVGWSNARWNDTGPANYEIGQFPYILEQTTPPCIPHSATATAVLDHGFVVDATITDGGCGYTNTPSVVIQGGGGTGATATAVVSNGVVVNIVITDAGIGYTSTPTIFISSPFGVQIALIKAVKPAFNNLTLTTNYQLQVSGDLNTWTNQGSPFTATNTSMVYPQYWDVDNWNSLFFRLQVVP